MSEEPENIQAWSAAGAEYEMTEETYRSSILPHNLKLNWGDPDELYNLIVISLQDGFAEDVAEAAKHLAEIDTDRERGATIYGIVLLHTNRERDAQKFFENYMKKNGESAIILVNYAKALSSQKEHIKILEKAIALDPNIENAVQWYAAIYRDLKGDAGYEQALKKVLEITHNKSWYALHALGAFYLEKGDPQKAEEHFRRALAFSQDEILLQYIAGSLGQAGQVRLALELVEPHANFGTPSIAAASLGINMVQLYIEAAQMDKAKRLLDTLYGFNIHEYKEIFDELTERCR